MIKNNVNSKCNVCLFVFKKKLICDDVATMCSALIRPLDQWSSEQMSTPHCTSDFIVTTNTHFLFSASCSYFIFLYFVLPPALQSLCLSSLHPTSQPFLLPLPSCETQTSPQSLHTLLHLFPFKIRLPVPVPTPPAGVPWVSSSDRCSPVCSPACSSGFGASPTREPGPL